MHKRASLSLQVVIFTVFFLCAGHFAQVPAEPAKEKKRAETANAQQTGQELDRVRREIKAATEAVQAEAAQRDQAAKAVRNADQALGKATRDYEKTHRAYEGSQGRLKQLDAKVSEAKAELADRQGRLSEMVRFAQQADRGDAWGAILNGQNPATPSRLTEYFSYIGDLRATEMNAIEKESQELQALEDQVKGEVERLAGLQEENKARTAALNQARAERKRSLDALTSSVANRTQQLKELRSNAAALEKLLERLSRVVRALPAPSKSTTASLPSAPGVLRGDFGHLHGQLHWPVPGKIVSRFGEERIGGLRWTGLLFETPSASNVHAAAAGRVIYADWLPGLGQLIVLDHGAGYISLYGYNDSLKRSVGDEVAANDVIASTAQSESGSSKLYFEIRDSGKPVDPATWLSHTH